MRWISDRQELSVVMDSVPVRLRSFASWDDAHASELEYRCDFADSYLRGTYQLSFLPPLLQRLEEPRCYVCAPTLLKAAVPALAAPAFEVGCEDHSIFDPTSGAGVPGSIFDCDLFLSSQDFGILSITKEWFIFCGLRDERAVFSCESEATYDQFVHFFWPGYLKWLDGIRTAT